MKSITHWAGLMAMTLCAGGCASRVDAAVDCSKTDCDALGADGANQETAVDNTAQPLIGGWASGPFTWAQGQPPRPLASVGSYVCALTRMAGHFEGTAEAVQVTHDGTTWFLQGRSKQTGVSGEAYCFPRSSFIGNAARTVLSSEISVEPFSFSSAHPCNGVYTTNMYARDAFGFLTGFNGKMAGGGEWGHVQQALSPDVPTFLAGQSCVPEADLYVFARAFRVGNLSTKLATFVNRTGGVGDANDIPEFTIGGNVSTATAVMAPTSDAMCALTLIKGKFSAAADAVQIEAESVRGVEHWVLRTSKGTSSDFVQAGARCFARDQR